MYGIAVQVRPVADAINAEFGTDHTQQWVANTVENTRERHLSDFGKSYEPPLYNVWKQQKKGGNSQHFGGSSGAGDRQKDWEPMRTC